jgi:hypothetical protein
MKKLLLLITLQMTLSSFAQKPVYYPFPESNAQWNIHYTLLGYPGFEEIYSILISGDTLINGLLYHKLQVPYIQVLGNLKTTEIVTGYNGAIRQDTLNRKVFIIPPADITEQLLYDFTLQVGDTVKGYIENIAGIKDAVESVDSVLVGINYHKRWKINSYYKIYFIEGIGSTYGLIEYSPGHSVDAPDIFITCFLQNGITTYPDTVNSCKLISTITPIDIESDQIKIYPNPSNGLLTIEFDKSLNVKEIRLTDLLGKSIFQEQTRNMTKIKIDNLQSGTYIVTLIDKDDKMTKKKIISFL